MTAFFLMYRMNNEYTARGEQPIQGILCLDEEKAAGKLHYLAREWQYFPGKLLTPDMLKENTGYYSRYISIGEYGGMELGDKNASPYGCGTYRMILILPKKEQTWALSLKKVFSAYRIYINGELAGEVGDPDEKTYKEQIMNRVFTFQGSEMAEIVIAVADKNHVKSGIQYIPVFGSPVQINMQRGLRVLGSGFAMAFCICVMFGVLTVHIRTRTYLSLMIDVWIVAAFLLEIFVDILPSAGIFYEASWISEAVKWVAAFYMLVNTFGETDCGYGKIVLVGTTVYACSLVADRIWPLYEPIIGGRFPETGGMVLAIAFACVLWRDLSEAYKIRLTYEIYSKQTELRLLAQKKHYEKLKAQMDETSRVRHDMRQHLRVLAALLEQKQYEEMQTYLCRYTREFQERLTYQTYCKNQVTDAILHYYEEICREKRISFQCQVEAPENTGIEDTDFCRLFGNWKSAGKRS